MPIASIVQVLLRGKYLPLRVKLFSLLAHKGVLICQRRLFYLQPIDNKRVEASFTASAISSDGGLLLFRDMEQQIGIIKALVSCIEDTRHPGYIQHSLEEIAAQRVYQIAAGYEDANDCDLLQNDTILKDKNRPDSLICGL